MDITEVFALIDEYKLRDKVKNECKKRKIDEVPYDMQGYHEVCSDLLQEVWLELRRKRDFRLKELKLSVIDKTDDPEINRLNKAMKEISDAQKTLKEVADYDYANR